MRVRRSCTRSTPCSRRIVARSRTTGSGSKTRSTTPSLSIPSTWPPSTPTVTGFGHASARLFAVPTSLGLETRILGGYIYLSPNSITDEVTITERGELFAQRSGYYYEHWERLDLHWRDKPEAEIATWKRSRSQAFTRTAGALSGANDRLDSSSTQPSTHVAALLLSPPQQPSRAYSRRRTTALPEQNIAGAPLQLHEDARVGQLP